jgi:hypothetical protein
MSYRSDQWFNLHNNALTGESLDRYSRSNAAGGIVTGAGNWPFQYPNRAIRDMDGNSRSPMKRGYIRSLAFGENKSEFAIQKCQFQFNPSQIAQSVQQNTSVLTFIQQDPAQYSQPMPGNVSFSFDLFFDRSAELNNNLSILGAPNTLDTDNPWETGNPSEIGVLHDLSHLYRVIGVGVNSAMEDYLNKSAIAANNAEIASSQNDPDAETQPEFDENQFNNDVSTFMNYNVGNTAFLLPLPCRIVFSSLYIVEGLVKDINVLFTKFTETMVPMQCSVQVMFEAKYIGFAKKNTFFDYVLRDLEQVVPATPSSDELNAYYEAISTDLAAVKMVFIRKGSNLVEEGGNSTTNYVNTGGVSIRGIISGAGTGSGSRITEEEGHLKILFPRERDNQNLRSLMAVNGYDVSLSASGTLTLYRFTDAPDGSGKQGLRQLEPNVFASLNPERGIGGPSADLDQLDQSKFEALENTIRRYLGRGILQSGSTISLPPIGSAEEVRFKNASKIVSISVGSSNTYENGGVTTASNIEEWDDMTDWACVSTAQKLGTPDDDVSVDRRNDGDTDVYFPTETNADLYSFGYLAKFTVTVTISINGSSQSTSAKGYRYYDRADRLLSSGLFTTINLNWPAPDNPVPIVDPDATPYPDDYDPTQAGAPEEAFIDVEYRNPPPQSRYLT